MCPGGPGPPWPALGDLARCSAQRYGFLQRCRDMGEKRKRMQSFLDIKRGTRTRHVYGKQPSQPLRSQLRLDPLPGATLTCHVLYPPGGTWLGRPPGEHSKLARVLTQSVCSTRMSDTACTSDLQLIRRKMIVIPKRVVVEGQLVPWMPA